MSDPNIKINNGKRFAFGENWLSVLKVLNEGSIQQVKSLPSDHVLIR